MAKVKLNKAQLKDEKFALEHAIKFYVALAKRAITPTVAKQAWVDAKALRVELAEVKAELARVK